MRFKLGFTCLIITIFFFGCMDPVEDNIDDPNNHLVYLSKVSNFRILSNVVPGDQIIIDAKIVNEKLNSFKFESTCHVNDKLVAKAEFLASMIKR